MTRVAILRAGYVALALAFAALGGMTTVGALLPLGLLLAFVGAILLTWSDDDLPKWAGFVLLAYFLLSIVAFLAATPMTINKGGRYFINAAPLGFADDIFNYLTFASPLMIGAAAVLAAWDRERPPRLLIWGAVAGFALFALLNIFLSPSGEDAARSQGSLLANLLLVSALAGAAGAAWSAARPEEIS